MKTIFSGSVLGLTLVLFLGACSEESAPAVRDAGLDAARDRGVLELGPEAGRDGPTKDGPTEDAHLGQDAPVRPDVHLGQDSRPDVHLGPDLAATGDAGVAFCQQLDDLYVKAVALAKQCSNLLPVVHCTHLVASKLICPCQPDKTYVETASSTLGQLAKQFAAAGCDKLFSCPKIACWTASSATCVSPGPGGQGSCTDSKP